MFRVRIYAGSTTVWRRDLQGKNLAFAILQGSKIIREQARRRAARGRAAETLRGRLPQATILFGTLFAGGAQTTEAWPGETSVAAGVRHGSAAEWTVWAAVGAIAAMAPTKAAWLGAGSRAGGGRLAGAT